LIYYGKKRSNKYKEKNFAFKEDEEKTRGEARDACEKAQEIIIK
jgi:hypothetical protein